MTRTAPLFALVAAVLVALPACSSGWETPPPPGMTYNVTPFDEDNDMVELVPLPACGTPPPAAAACAVPRTQAIDPVARASGTPYPTMPGTTAPPAPRTAGGWTPSTTPPPPPPPGDPRTWVSPR